MPPRPLLVLAAAWLIEAHVELGALDQAHEVLASYYPADPADAVGGAGLDSPHLLAARGAPHLAAGRHRQGIDDYRACGKLLGSLDVQNPAVIPWRSRAVPAALALGHVDLAVAMAENELAAARVWGAPRAVGRALHVFALAIARRGCDPVVLLEESAELLAFAQASAEQARVLHQLGLVQAARDQRAAARKSLDTAIALARDCHNPLWVHRLEAVRLSSEGRAVVISAGALLDDRIRTAVAGSPFPTDGPQVSMRDLDVPTAPCLDFFRRASRNDGHDHSGFLAN